MGNALLFDRMSKDERHVMKEKIAEHQRKACKGQISPLIIAPEGGTTNGTALIQFKPGAFGSLLPI